MVSDPVPCPIRTNESASAESRQLNAPVYIVITLRNNRQGWVQCLTLFPKVTFVSFVHASKLTMRVRGLSQ